MQEIANRKENLNPDIRIAVVGGWGKIGRLFRERLHECLPYEQVTPIGRNDYDLLDVRKPEMILVTTPQPLDTVVKELSTRLIDGQTIIFAQNGILPIEMISKAFAEKNVNLVRCSLLTPVVETQTGKVVYDPSKLRMGLSQVAGRNVKTTADLFEATGFEVGVYPDYKGMEWTKLLLNSIGSTGEVTGLPPYQTLNDPELFDLEMAGFLARLKILHDGGISFVDFPGAKAKLFNLMLTFPRSADVLRRFKNTIANKIAIERSNLPPAAFNLIKNHKPTETLFYHGPFIKLGKTLGLRSPVDEAILYIVIDNAADILVPELSSRSIELRKQLLLARYDNYDQRGRS